MSGEATAWRSHELSGAKDSERSERGQASEARTLCTFVWNSYTVHDNEWKRLSFAHPARCRRSPLQAKPAAGAGGVGVEFPQQTPKRLSFAPLAAPVLISATGNENSVFDGFLTPADSSSSEGSVCGPSSR